MLKSASGRAYERHRDIADSLPPTRVPNEAAERPTCARHNQQAAARRSLPAVTKSIWAARSRGLVLAEPRSPRPGLRLQGLTEREGEVAIMSGRRLPLPPNCCACTRGAGIGVVKQIHHHREMISSEVMVRTIWRLHPPERNIAPHTTVLVGPWRARTMLPWVAISSGGAGPL